MVSVTEAAERLDVTRQAILNRLETGSLAGQRVGKTWVLPAVNVTPTARALRSVES